ADRSPLGELDSVQLQILDAVPGIQFFREPSGLEKIAAAAAQGVEFPEVIRNHFMNLPAKIGAVFEGEQYSVRFYGFSAQPLEVIHAEIRGEGNPVPMLAALCFPQGWIVVDDSTNETIDLAGGRASGWEAFGSYKDQVLRGIPASGNPERVVPRDIPSTDPE
ncbi:MAG: hypothetical protein ACRCZF_07225, partial [Gemmataceae bacterium]